MKAPLGIAASMLSVVITFSADAQTRQEGTPYATTFQIDAAHTGHAAMPKFKGQLKVLWSRELSGGQVSYPLIANGMIFVTVADTLDQSANGTKLFALDAASGATAWHKNIQGIFHWSNAAYENGSLFVVTVEGDVTAIDAASGATEWKKRLHQQVYSAPVTINGQLFLDVYNGVGEVVYAIDEKTGKLIWMSGGKGNGSSSPAIGDNEVYVTYPCEYFGYSEQNGDLEWYQHKTCDGGGGWAPVYFQGYVYERDKDLGTCIIRDAQTGAAKGKFLSGSPPSFFSRKDVAYGVEFVNGRMRGFNPVSGSVLWTFSGDRHLTTSPITVDQYAIVGSDLGNLFVVDATTGRQSWSGNIGSQMQSPIEGDVHGPLIGLEAADGIIAVPAGTHLVVLAPR